MSICTNFYKQTFLIEAFLCLLVLDNEVKGNFANNETQNYNWVAQFYNWVFLIPMFGYMISSLRHYKP